MEQGGEAAERARSGTEDSKEGAVPVRQRFRGSRGGHRRVQARDGG